MTTKIVATIVNRERSITGVNTDFGADGLVSADLPAVARSSGRRKPAWTYPGDDLSANLVLLPPGGLIAEHVNQEVDVLILGIDGEGVVEVEVEVDGQSFGSSAGRLVAIPRGSGRAMRTGTAVDDTSGSRRRRSGLRPTTAAETRSSPATQG